MRIDPVEDRAMIETAAAPRPRRPWQRLLNAVLQLAGRNAELVGHAERGWASVTFSGTRHTLVLAFAGTKGIAEAEAFIEALPEHEFSIAGHLVADARVLAVDQAMQPRPRLTVEVELLLLEDR